MTTMTLPEEVFNLYQEVLIKTLNEGILTGANADLIRAALDAEPVVEPVQQVTQPERKPLTEDEIGTALDKAGVPDYKGCEVIDTMIARAIEAAHGIGEVKC